MRRRERLARAIVASLLPGWHLIEPAYEIPVWVDDAGTVTVECGSGPEFAWGRPYDNPNWHVNRAANEMAIAETLRGHQHMQELRKVAPLPDLSDELRDVSKPLPRADKVRAPWRKPMPDGGYHGGPPVVRKDGSTPIVIRTPPKNPGSSSTPKQ